MMNGIADGLCIMDFTQSSVPSHVKYIDVISAATLMQSQCVELGTPPCMSCPASVPMKILHRSKYSENYEGTSLWCYGTDHTSAFLLEHQC